jgi:hypothetical protein
MAKAPGDRFPSAAELAKALEDFTTGAVTEREPAAVRLFTTAALVLFSVVLVIALWGTVAMNASILHQGPAGLGTAFVAFDGVVLALVEWRTRGRFKLFPFGVAFGIATFLGGVSGTASGFGRTMASVAQATDMSPELLHAAMLEGLYESISLLAVSSLYAAIQAFVWAITWRSVARASRTPVR